MTAAALLQQVLQSNATLLDNSRGLRSYLEDILASCPPWQRNALLFTHQQAIPSHLRKGSNTPNLIPPS